MGVGEVGVWVAAAKVRQGCPVDYTVRLSTELLHKDGLGIWACRGMTENNTRIRRERFRSLYAIVFFMRFFFYEEKRQHSQLHPTICAADILQVTSGQSCTNKPQCSVCLTSNGRPAVTTLLDSHRHTAFQTDLQACIVRPSTLPIVQPVDYLNGCLLVRVGW
jgi:hypothetical protein